MPTFTELVENLSTHPLETIALLIILLLVAAAVIRVFRLDTGVKAAVEKALAAKIAEIAHGDGNGAPSLKAIETMLKTLLARQDRLEARQDASDERCRRNHRRGRAAAEEGAE